MNFFYNIYYTHSEITDETILLALFKAKSYSELYEMMSHILPDRMLASFMESVVEMNEKIIGSPVWLDEVCAKQIEEDDIKYAKEEAMLIGLFILDFYVKVSYGKKIISKRQFEVLGRFILEIRKMVYGLKKRNDLCEK